ncbi:MAG: outer membrane beta-barrel family protein, partial [Muribaculaceae bacterium]|nr:outer membrane beta-barrel family protein [Muribaculaceae bacterium]
VIQNFWGNNKRQVLSHTTSKRRKQLMDGKIGLNYSTVSGHTIGAYYQYSHAPTKTNSDALTSFIFSDLKPSVSATSRIEKENYYGNLVDAYYSGAWGKWAVDASFDFLWRRDNADQQIQETFTDSQTTLMGLGDRSHGRMLAGELHLSKPISKGNFMIGAEYTNSIRSEDFLSNTSSIASVDNKIHESNISVYAQISRTIGRVMLQGGLRYEHINSTYYEDNIRKAEQSASYNEILPSFSLALPVRKTMFQLSYSRKYNRPSYAQMSSAVHYVDQYTYETGNPDLKNSFTDNLTLNFKYNWLMTMVTYKHIHNKIITTCYEYPTNPDITLLMKENSRNDANNLELLVSIQPGFIGKFYYPVAMTGIVTQFYDIDFRGSMKHMNSPMFLARLNNIFRLPKDFLVYANLNYRSSFDGENIHMGRSWQIDLSLTKTFNRHWDASLSFNDVFNSARKTSMTIYSGQFEYISQKYNTLRGVEFSIGYKFNVTKSKYRGKGAGNKEKERL